MQPIVYEAARGVAVAELPELATAVSAGANVAVRLRSRSAAGATCALDNGNGVPMLNQHLYPRGLVSGVVQA